MDPSSVLAFWFSESIRDPQAAQARAALWYRSNSKADAHIKAQFGDILTLLEQKQLVDWSLSTRQAFANDAQALAIASELIQQNQHLSLSPMEQVFLYHPFKHAENLACQKLSVELFTRLLKSAPLTWQKQLQNFLHHAQEHHDIVTAFGRFPHRNLLLGRTDTEAEKAFLTSARRHGQTLVKRD
jgi:uncharacterized protein (DUF924 family)